MNQAAVWWCLERTGMTMRQAINACRVLGYGGIALADKRTSTSLIPSWSQTATSSRYHGVRSFVPRRLTTTRMPWS